MVSIKEKEFKKLYPGIVYFSKMLKKKINWILGISYFLILSTGFIIQSVFPFEIVQEVFIADNQTNFLINEITQLIVGFTVLIMLSHLCLLIGYYKGVAKGEKNCGIP